jgi:hypothetical protein
MNNPLITYVIKRKAIPGYIKLDAEECMDIVNSMTREQAIEFLVWNDPNGVLSDTAAIGEGLDPLKSCEAKVYAMKILWEASL